MTKRKRTSKPASKPKHPVLKRFIAALIILCPLIVGLISAALTSGDMTRFATLTQPPLAPPAWLFPVAWAVLYLLMGVASYLIYRQKTSLAHDKTLKTTELIIFYVQLVFNFFWTLFFFKWELRFFAFGWLVAMWSLVLALIILVFKKCRIAAWLLMPYLLWCTFAAYLNIMVALLN